MKKKTILAIFIFWTIIISSQNFSKYLLVDQFGYPKDATKIAIIRDPQTGFDSNEAYSPGTKINVHDAVNDNIVFSGTIEKWRNGETDKISGDKVWSFDFSKFSTNGSYYLKDETTNEESAIFKVSDDVYNEILKVAIKVFFYQRSGFEKKANYAGVGWADGASHLKALQDKNCRLYNQKNNAATERDLSGGWYDAGDLNKYTPWHANYIISMLNTFEENKLVWTDDYNIPESGNGIPDFIDEIVFGMDWLLKMNQSNGSSLSIVGAGYASPPSSATEQSVYGPATTNATLRSAAAFALGARILKNNYPTKYSTYADTLKARAIKAYKWSINNPYKIFNNNNSANGSNGLGGGNQETDSMGRFTAKMSASLYLYELTQEKNYLDFFENNYQELPLLKWGNYISQYFTEQHNLLLHYTTLPIANTAIVNNIKSAAVASIKKTGDFYSEVVAKSDPYNAYIKDYNWGSNQYKSDYGNMFYNMILFGLDPNNAAQYKIVAQGYLNYLHGVNPLAFVYLSNMSKLGAENNIKEFYHSWFADKSPLWDREGVSTYGPAPGFLVGGPNQFYEKDGCCPSNCGSAENNAPCNENLSPPLNQPPMKSYKDFNTSWPQNSWQITENSNGYQIAYIRLLSKFVKTGTSSLADQEIKNKIVLSPNPSNGSLSISLPNKENAIVKIYNHTGQLVDTKIIENGISFTPNISISGIYVVQVEQKNGTYRASWVVIK